MLFEINYGHKHPDVSDNNSREREGVDFIINSDAHFTDTVGDLRYGSEVVAELKIDPDHSQLFRWGRTYPVGQEAQGIHILIITGYLEWQVPGSKLPGGHGLLLC